MKLIIFLLIVFLFSFSQNSFSIVSSSNTLSPNERVYVYFVKEYYTKYDCSEKVKVLISFEFNSEGNSRKESRTFIDKYLEGMEKNDWKEVFFYDYEYNNHNKYKCNSSAYKQKYIPPDFVYFELVDKVRTSNCFYSKLLNPLSGLSVDVVVHDRGENRNKVVYSLVYN